MFSSKHSVPVYPTRVAKLEPIVISEAQLQVIERVAPLTKVRATPTALGIALSVVAGIACVVLCTLSMTPFAKEHGMYAVFSWWSIGAMLIAAAPWLISYGKFCNAFGLPTLRYLTDGTHGPQQSRHEACTELEAALRNALEFNACLGPTDVPTLPTRRAQDERYRRDHALYHAVIRAKRLIKQYY